jgi:hypothetical protein
MGHKSFLSGNAMNRSELVAAVASFGESDEWFHIRGGAMVGSARAMPRR